MGNAVNFVLSRVIEPHYLHSGLRSLTVESLEQLEMPQTGERWYLDDELAYRNKITPSCHACPFDNIPSTPKIFNNWHLNLPGSQRRIVAGFYGFEEFADFVRDQPFAMREWPNIEKSLLSPHVSDDILRDLEKGHSLFYFNQSPFETFTAVDRALYETGVDIPGVMKTIRNLPNLSFEETTDVRDALFTETSEALSLLRKWGFSQYDLCG